VKSDELQESFELCTLEILAEIPDTFGTDVPGGDLKRRVEGFLSEYKTLMEEKQEADRAVEEVESSTGRGRRMGRSSDGDFSVNRTGVRVFRAVRV
jgi:predicted ArsR family transcriptional regulator